MAVNAVWLLGMGSNSRSAVLWRGMGWCNDLPNPNAWFEKVLSAGPEHDFVCCKPTIQWQLPPCDWATCVGFWPGGLWRNNEYLRIFSVAPRRLDESILKRSDGLGTVTIIQALYFRWRRGSSFRSLYWCTALPLSRPLLKTSLQPLQRLELLLLPEAWCGSCGESINSFAWSVFILWIWFHCFIDLFGHLWRNACLEIELLDWYFNHFRCLFKFPCSNAWFVY